MAAFFVLFFVVMAAAAPVLFAFFLPVAAAFMVMMVFHFGEFLVEIRGKSLDFHRNLFLRGEVFDLDEVLIEVVFAGDDREFRVRPDRFLEKRA